MYTVVSSHTFSIHTLINHVYHPTPPPPHLSDILVPSKDDSLLELTRERSCWNDHRGDMSEAYHGGKLRCYVHLMEEGMCYRVNTLAAYIEANRMVS